VTLPLAEIHAPEIDYKALSPLMATLGGSIVVLMVGLLRGRFVQTLLVPALTTISLVTAMALTIWIWDPGVKQPILEGSLTVDTLGLGIAMCVALSWRATAPREAGHGEYHSMLLGSITGMVLLAESSDLITLFVGLELLSIPLYVLCATELRRRTSLEAGLKYLVIGSVGSATLLYGLALIY
jgi:NADH-quinone oxidoreductase subunit N